MGDITWDYTYNVDGLRTSKSNGATTYNYTYTGDKLTCMTVGDNTLYFAYDASGVPMSVTYNDVTYYYVTNVQGDVIALVNSTGVEVATYAYDAWGNPIDIPNAPTSEIGTLNPLRYRSYVWDSETGLYYLQSRYYNPELGRFINADIYTATGQGLLGNNMFAYCGNNPVFRIDTSGCGWVAVLIGIAVGAGIGVATSWIGSVVTGQEFTWRDVGVAALSGGISSLGAVGLVVGGIINGVYTGYTVYEDGGTLFGSIGSGIISALFSMVSFGDLATAGKDLASIAISGFIDLVFGTGFSSMDSAISKAIAENNPGRESSSSKKSALDVVMRKRRISTTRIYNGRTIIVGSKNCRYPGRRHNDPNRVYCYVQF